ncbi:acetyl esterase/lipase [Sphingomonas zeicaulis]|uniref:alpha/beta hydrolase n=1 Tax=Sphingomonas zeicaulis TaxID=1632740 RepID=UPI003D2576BA
MELDRRGLLLAAAGLGVGAAAAPAIGAAASARAVPPPAGFTRINLWPGKAPGGERVTVTEESGPRKPDSGPEDSYYAHITTPTLTILRPKKPNGRAMLLIPGGGYVRVVIGHEGYAIAHRLAEAGYTCFILLYRLPADGWAAGPEAPLQDAQRALRTMRSMAGKEGFDAEKIGVMGFSAGGHLAAWLTARAPVETYKPIDAIDREPVRAAIAAYMYPVILMQGDHVHRGSRTQLLGADPAPEKMRAYSLDQDVSAETPPVFLAHALDDKSVTPENSLAMLAALRAKQIPVECHLFEKGGHGFGIVPQAGATALWPEMFLKFAAAHGV